MMRNRFGLTNQIHEHDLPFIDRPDVLVQFFGEEGLVEKGGEATWVPPLPFYLELLGGVFNGDNETAFGLGSIKNPLVTGRARTFFELGDFGAHPARHVRGQRAPARPAEQSHPRLGRQVQVRAGGLAASACSPLRASCSIRCARSIRRHGGDDRRGRRRDPRHARAETDPQSGRLVRSMASSSPSGSGCSAASAGLPLRLDGVSDRPGSPVGRAAVPDASCPRSSCASASATSTRRAIRRAAARTPTSAARAIKDEFFFQSTFILGAHPSHPF